MEYRARQWGIPMVTISFSGAESEIQAAHRLHANCYTKKPLEMDGFLNVMDYIRHFWLETALFPCKGSNQAH